MRRSPRRRSRSCPFRAARRERPRRERAFPQGSLLERGQLVPKLDGNCSGEAPVVGDEPAAGGPDGAELIEQAARQGAGGQVFLVAADQARRLVGGQSQPLPLVEERVVQRGEVLELGEQRRRQVGSGIARSAPIVQRSPPASGRLAQGLRRDRAGPTATPRARARSARAARREPLERAEERPLIGPRLERRRIEEDARARAAAYALERQRDQVAEALREEVLVREQPVVAREVELARRAIVSRSSSAPSRRAAGPRPARRRRSRRGRPLPSGCAPAPPARLTPRTPRAARARRAARSSRRSRRQGTSTCRPRATDRCRSSPLTAQVLLDRLVASAAGAAYRHDLCRSSRRRPPVRTPPCRCARSPSAAR